MDTGIFEETNQYLEVEFTSEWLDKLQNAWNREIGSEIALAFDTKDYIQYCSNSEEEYMSKYTDIYDQVTETMTGLRFISYRVHNDLSNKVLFGSQKFHFDQVWSFWCRVKSQNIYSEFYYRSDKKKIDIRLNLLFVNIYYIFYHNPLTKDFGDDVVFLILDYIPRRLLIKKQESASETQPKKSNDNNDGSTENAMETILLESYQKSDMNKGRNIENIERIANRAKVDVQCIYYILDIFEKWEFNPLFQKFAARIMQVKAIENINSDLKISDQ